MALIRATYRQGMQRSVLLDLRILAISAQAAIPDDRRVPRACQAHRRLLRFKAYHPWQHSVFRHQDL